MVTKSSGAFETMSNAFIYLCNTLSLVLKCGNASWSLKVSSRYR
jgi:hypothetical protein